MLHDKVLVLTGYYTGLVYTVAIDIAGLEHVALATGVCGLSGGIAILSAGPLAGKGLFINCRGEP